jgi:hypothetical protein
MAERDPTLWPSGPAAGGAGADSIAAELAARITAPPPAPGDALDWAAAAAGWEREAEGLPPGPAAARLWLAAGRVHADRLAAPAPALECFRRAFQAAPALAPAREALRAAALAAGDLLLAADAAAAEAVAAQDPGEAAAHLLLEARLRAAAGRPDEARACVADAARAAPDRFAVAEELARGAAEDGDRSALVDAWERCGRAAVSPTLGAQYLAAAAGLAEDGLGDLARAGALAVAAFERDPSDPVVRAAALRHAGRLGRTDVQLAALRSGAEAASGPAAAEAWLALARAEEAGPGGEGAALASLERARAAVPADPRVLAALARLRERASDPAGASEALDALAAAHLALGPAGSRAEAVAARLRRAELEESQLGRPAVAIACARAVVDLEPGNRAALSALGRLCARAGDHAGLAEAFLGEAAAARDDRERAERTFRAAEVLDEKLGDAAGAAARCREALALDPGLVAARAALERILERTGDWPALLQLLEDELGRLAEPGARIATLQRIARVAETRLGDLERAAAALGRLLELAPESRATLPVLSDLLGRLGRHREAADLVLREASLADDPARRVALLQRRAEQLELHGADGDAALAAWEDVRAAAPSHPPALRALGRLYARTARWEALARLHRVEADAAPPEAAADLLVRSGEIVERRLGREDEAVAVYREALTLDPAHRAALDALARICRARGEHEHLAELLHARAAAAGAPSDRAEALLEAGRLWEEALSDPARAAEAFEEALRAVPGHAGAAAALDRLYPALGRWDDLAALRASAAGGEDLAARIARARLALERGPAAPASDLEGAVRSGDVAGSLLEAAGDHPAAHLLALRAHPADAPGRALARAALARLGGPEEAAALGAAAALDVAAVNLGAAVRRAAAAGDPALAAEREAALAGEPAALAGHLEARRAAAADPALRADLALRAGEAWLRAGEEDRALAAFRAAREDEPDHLPALRAARAILLRRGAWREAREAWETEAESLRDPRLSAAAWLEAGRIAEEQEREPSSAARAYRAAAERDPGAELPVARLEGLLGAGGAAELARAHAARAGAAVEPARAAEAWLAAAEAALRSGAAGEAEARGHLERALGAAPEGTAFAAAAHALRGRLRAAAGDAAGALADAEAVIASGGEPGTVADAHLAAAEVLHERLGEPARAATHLAAALALSPGRAPALARLARIHAAAGSWPAAADALRRLVALPGFAAAPRAERAAHLVELARLEANHAAPDALAACRRALEVDPGHPEALRLLVELEGRAGDPRGLAAALEASASATLDGPRRADVLVEAARLHAGPLRARPAAIQRLRDALYADPGHLEARATLAGLLEEGSPAAAIDEHRRLLDRDPLRVASWSALYRLFERTRGHDRAYVAATVLRWLGAPPPTPDAERILREGDRQVLAAPPALAPEDWDLVRDGADRGPLPDLAAAAGDVLAAALRAGPPARGEPARADHPFRKALAEAARAFGAEPCELHPAAPGRLAVDPGDPPALLVGVDLARKTTAREQRFLLGRAAARLRTRSALAETFAPEVLAAGLAALVRAVAPSTASRTGAAEPDPALVLRLGKLLVRKVRKASEAPAQALAAAGLPDAAALSAWRAAAARTAAAAGLALCGDVPTALAIVLREAGADPAGGPDAARAVPAAAALLAFAASEAHLALRQKLRVAVA